MNKSLLIAKYTFKQLLKSKIMLNCFWIGLALMTFTYITSEFSFGNPKIVAMDFGVGVSSLAAVFIAIFLGASLLSDEVESRTVYITLSRPVSRSSFIVGKIMGMSLILMINILIIMGCSLVIYFLFGGEWSSLIFVYIIFGFLEALLLLLVVVFFSLITNKVISIMNTLVIFILGHAVPNSLDINMVENSEFLSILLKGYTYIMPDLDRFNLKKELAFGLPMDASTIINSSIYSVFYVSLLLMIIIFSFNRKELT